jgi:dihydroxyacetone kinase-like predicted kinase
MAAQAAAKMTVKNVAVIPTTNIPQGLNAMLRLVPDGDFTKIVEEMQDSLDEVETGEITIATRTVDINGVQVHEGECIALLNGKLVNSSKSLLDACLKLLEIAETKDRERITLFYGNNITKTEVNKIVDQIRLQYPSHEIELHEGGQPHYQFIIAIE